MTTASAARQRVAIVGVLVIGDPERDRKTAQRHGLLDRDRRCLAFDGGARCIRGHDSTDEHDAQHGTGCDFSHVDTVHDWGIIQGWAFDRAPTVPRDP